LADLEVRPLTTEVNRIEYADLAIRAFGPQDPERVWDRTEPLIADGRALGAFARGRLIGTALYHDMHQWWYGRQIPMAGVAGVKVAPEYRGQGAGEVVRWGL